MEKNRLLNIEEKLLILKNQCKPSDSWEDDLDEDEMFEELYSEDGILAVSNALNNYIDNIISLKGNYTNEVIKSEIKNIVIALNEISELYDSLIETMEREQLVQFIESVLDIIDYEYSGDVTEEWREW